MGRELTMRKGGIGYEITMRKRARVESVHEKRAMG